MWHCGDFLSFGTSKSFVGEIGMNTVNHKRQKAGWRTLNHVFSEANSHWIIHYSCESFYESASRQSSRIASISVRNLDSAQTKSFSISLTAEKMSIADDQIWSRYREVESVLLAEFFDFVRNNPDNTYIHWNMRDSNYGFEALEHRFQVLHREKRGLINIPQDKKIDLARLMKDIYGNQYIEKPCLGNILQKNNIESKHFIEGVHEATLFQDGQFGDLHRSTLRKVEVIAEIARRSHEHNFKVNTPIVSLHVVPYLRNQIVENKTIAFLGSAGSIISLILFRCS